MTPLGCFGLSIAKPRVMLFVALIGREYSIGTTIWQQCKVGGRTLKVASGKSGKTISLIGGIEGIYVNDQEV